MKVNSAGKTKVLLVFDNMDLSGAEKVALNLLRHCASSEDLEARGVICMDDKLNGGWEGAMIEHLGAGIPPGGSLVSRVLRGFRLLPRLASLCAWADIVIPVTPPAALWAGVAGKWVGKPVAPWVHYDLDGLEREGLAQGRKVRDWLMLRLYKSFIPNFRRIVFVSNQTKESFLRRRKHPLTAKNWIVLPNVYDSSGFSKESSRTEMKLSRLKEEGKPLLLVLGRVFRQKRWEDAVSAAELLHRQGRVFNLVFVGNGIEMHQLERCVKGSPARESIHLLGPDPNPMPALALADALVLTSLYEAWPTVILEAFDAGIPVFAYDCPSGPGEMLGRAGERGFLTGESPEEMAEALESWFWVRSSESRNNDLVRTRQNTTEFLDRHRPKVALQAWTEGISRLSNR